MGDIFGSGGGGGGSGGDEQNTTEKALPSPAQIAATRAAFNTASGIAGVARNLPYYAQVASSPSYRQALQNTANTWSDWMGTAPLNLSEGMAPITQGQFGSVIDAGQAMNDQIAGMDPATQYMLGQWVQPGPITPGSPYAPAIYDPYVQQKPLLHQGNAAAGGVGTIGTGGIPTTTLPSGFQTPVMPPVTPPVGGGGTGGGTGGTGGGTSGGTGGGVRWGGGGANLTGRRRTRRPRLAFQVGSRTGSGGAGQGGMGQSGADNTGYSFGGGTGTGEFGNLGNLGGLFGGLPAGGNPDIGGFGTYR